MLWNETWSVSIIVLPSASPDLAVLFSRVPRRRCLLSLQLWATSPTFPYVHCIIVETPAIDLTNLASHYACGMEGTGKI
jgi:hypothetical protein